MLVAQYGATCLGPLIASGKCGMDLAFQFHVLRAASLDYLALLRSSVVNEGSKFWSFIVRCYLAGNPKACYF